MHTLTEIKAALTEVLDQIGQFITANTSGTLHAKPTDKWSIAEELMHLAKANQGSSVAFCQPTDKLPPTAHEPRGYEAIAAQYRERSQTIGVKAPPKLIPGDEVLQLTVEQCQSQFASASEALLHSLNNWAEEGLDAVTVWKHPLLGPVTAREMLLFTVFHNRHHLASLHEKLRSAEISTGH